MRLYLTACLPLDAVRLELRMCCRYPKLPRFGQRGFHSVALDWVWPEQGELC